MGKQLLTKLLADNTTKDFSSAIPSVVLLAVVLAVASVVAIVRTELQRLLSELVPVQPCIRWWTRHTAPTWPRFEDPRFHERLQACHPQCLHEAAADDRRAVVGRRLGARRRRRGAALATIEPLFLALGLVAAVPLTMTSIRVSRALYRFAVYQTPTDRERFYIQSLLVENDSAKEIRAYGLAPFLRPRLATLYERRIQALRRLVRRRTTQGLVGGVLSALSRAGSWGC